MSVLRNFSHEGFQLRLVLMNHIFQNGPRESFPMDSTPGGLVEKFSERKLMKNDQWVPTGLDLDLQQMVFDQKSSAHHHRSTKIRMAQTSTQNSAQIQPLFCLGIKPCP